MKSTFLTASERYLQTLKSYRNHLSESGTGTLHEHCRLLHVNYRGMLKWMHSHNLSVRAIKSTTTTESLEKAAQQSSMFVQVTPVSASSESTSSHLHKPSKSVSMTPDILDGVSFNFSDGTVMTVSSGTAESIALLAMKFKSAM